MRSSQKPRGGPAIVTTLRNTGPSLDGFIAYHLSIGFSRLYLVFDDPADPDMARVKDHPQVTAIPHDAALEAAWKTLPSYPGHAAFVETEVMSRQVLNATHVMAVARQAGHSWLLHIDADELFYSPLETAAQHFERLDPLAIDTILYQNYEAIPESDAVDDPFRQVTLFKPPAKRIEARHPYASYKALTADIPQMPPKVFNFYTTGKSAVRLSSPDMEPSGVHAFGRVEPCHGGQTEHHFILHYACCGFDAFWTKYWTLGAFSDTWWGAHDISASIGPFHIQARDVVGRGDKAAALDFYRRRMVIDDPSRVSRLISTGLAERVTGPAEILSRTTTKPAGKLSKLARPSKLKGLR